MSMSFEDCVAFLATLNDPNGTKNTNQNGQDDIFPSYNNYGTSDGLSNNLLFQNFSNVETNSCLNFNNGNINNDININNNTINGYLSPDSFSSNISSSPDAQDSYFSQNKNANLFDSSNMGILPENVGSRAEELESINELLANDAKFNPQNISIKLEKNSSLNNSKFQLSSQKVKGEGPRHSTNVAIKMKPVGSSYSSLKNNLSPNGSKVTKPKKEKSSHNMIEKRYRTNINDKIKLLRDCVPSLKVLCADSGEEDVQLDGLQPAKKLNKATILSKATEYIRHLELKNEQLQQENERLKCGITSNSALDDHMSHQSSISSTSSSPVTANNSTYYNNSQRENPERRRGHSAGSQLGNKVLLGSLACVVGAGALDDFGSNDGNTKSLMAMPMVIYRNNGGLDIFPSKMFAVLGKLSLVIVCACYIFNLDFGFFKMLSSTLLGNSCSKDEDHSYNSSIPSLQLVRNFYIFWFQDPATVSKRIEKDLESAVLSCISQSGNENVDPTCIQGIYSPLFQSIVYLPNKLCSAEQNADIQFNKSFLVKLLTFNKHYLIKKAGDIIAKHLFNSSQNLLDPESNGSATLIQKFSYEETIAQIPYIHKLLNKYSISSATCAETFGSWRANEYLHDALCLLLEDTLGSDVSDNDTMMAAADLLMKAKEIAPSTSPEFLGLELVHSLIKSDSQEIISSIAHIFETDYEKSISDFKRSSYTINVNHSILIISAFIKCILKGDLPKDSKLQLVLQLVLRLQNVSLENLETLKVELVGITGLSIVLTELQRFIQGFELSTSLNSDAQLYMINFLLSQLEEFSGFCRVWLGSKHGNAVDNLELRKYLIQRLVDFNKEFDERIVKLDSIKNNNNLYLSNHSNVSQNLENRV